MGLLNTYGDFNKVVSQGRDINYEVTPYKYNQNSTSPVTLFWTIKRTSTTQYSYVGMDEATALSCAEETRNKLTRHYADYGAFLYENENALPTVYITQDYVYECRSTINTKKDTGHMWSVDVTESDTDQICTTEEVTDATKFEELFQLAFQRELNTANGSIAIKNARWYSNQESIVAGYNAMIPNYNKNLLSVQLWDESEKTWENLSHLDYNRVTDTEVDFYADDNKTFRLAYPNGIYSPKKTTHNPVVPVIKVINCYMEDAYSPSDQFQVAKSSYKITMFIATTEQLLTGYVDNTGAGKKNMASYYLMFSDDQNTWNTCTSIKVESFLPNQYKITGYCNKNVIYVRQYPTIDDQDEYASTKLWAYFEKSYNGYVNESDRVRVVDNVTQIGLKGLPKGLSVTPSCLYFDSPFNWDWQTNDGEILSAQVDLPKTHTYDVIRYEYNPYVGSFYVCNYEEWSRMPPQWQRLYGDSYANIEINGQLTATEQPAYMTNFLSGAEPYISEMKFCSHYKDMRFGSANGLSALRYVNLGGVTTLSSDSIYNCGNGVSAGMTVYGADLSCIDDVAFRYSNIKEIYCDDVECISSQGFNAIYGTGLHIYIRHKTMQEIYDMDTYPFGLEYYESAGEIHCSDGNIFFGT